MRHPAAWWARALEHQEHRDAHVNSGMEVGLQEAMDLLEEVALSLR